MIDIIHIPANRKGRRMIQFISMGIGFVVAVVVAYLTHRRPGKNWEWISTGGFYFLLILAGTVAQYERSLRSPLDDYVYVCSNGVTYPSYPLVAASMDENLNCRRMRATPEPSFGGLILDWFADTIVSALLDIPGDVAGTFAGIFLAGGKPPRLINVLKE